MDYYEFTNAANPHRRERPEHGICGCDQCDAAAKEKS